MRKRAHEDWTITECFEGDGAAGAAFEIPNGLTVWVSEWYDRGQPSKMTEAAFTQATIIRNLVQKWWEEGKHVAKKKGKK